FLGESRELSLAVDDVKQVIAGSVKAVIIVRIKLKQFEANVIVAKLSAPLVATHLHIPAGLAIESAESNQHMRLAQFNKQDHLIIEVQWLGRRNVNKNGADTAAIRVHGWVARTNGDDLTAPAIEVVDAESQQGVWAVFLAPGLDAQTVS